LPRRECTIDGYEKEIKEKSLDYLYRSFCLEPLGAFGDDAWRLIREVCGRDHPHAHDESCMWRRPDPKKDFVLSYVCVLYDMSYSTHAHIAGQLYMYVV
jgi:hypothetical protein